MIPKGDVDSFMDLMDQCTLYCTVLNNYRVHFTVLYSAVHFHLTHLFLFSGPIVFLLYTYSPSGLYLVVDEILSYLNFNMQSSGSDDLNFIVILFQHSFILARSKEVFCSKHPWR